MYHNASDFYLHTSLSMIPDKEKISYFHGCNYDNPANHPLHINSGIEIFIPLQGDSDFMVDGNLYSLTHGDVMIIRPHEVHKTVLRRPCLYERASTVLPPDTYEGFRSNPLSPILNSSCTHFTPDEETRGELMHIIDAMDKLLMKEPDEIASMQIFTYISQLVCLVSRSAAQNTGYRRIEETSPSRCRQILAYINDHFTTITSVSMIADTFGLSVPYLSTLFKQEIGVNLNAYLRARKIGLAKRLLSEGATVTDACFECGFGDCSYFIRCFKSSVGVTPLQYRKQRRFDQ